MKNYVANPQYSDASGDNWKVTNNLDAAQALNDLTKLSVGTVKNGSDYWAAHVEDVSRLLSAYTSLAIDATGKRKDRDAHGDFVIDVSGNDVINDGDPYLYADDVSGFTTGQVGVVLEGLQPNHPQYSPEATSPDCPESEWLPIQATGLIPTVAGKSTEALEYCAYLPATMPAPTISTNLVQQTTLASYIPPTPTRVAKDNPIDRPSYYISAAGDSQANKNLLTLLPDYTDGFEVVSINKGGGSTTVTLAGWTESFTVGQTVTLACEDTDMGWFTGKITEVPIPAEAKSVLATWDSGDTIIVTSTPTHNTDDLRVGMLVEADGIPDGTVITEIIGTGSFVISQPATLDGAGVLVSLKFSTFITDLNTTASKWFHFPTAGNSNLARAFTGTFGNGTFSITCSFASGSTELQIDLGSTQGLSKGQSITGGGIQAGTTITGWDISGFLPKVYISKPTASAQTSISLTVHLKSNQFLATSGASGLSIGQTITAYGVPAGTRIERIATSPAVITVSATMTGSGSHAGVAYNSKVFGATLEGEEVRLTHQKNVWDCGYFTTPYYTTSSNRNSRAHGRDLYFPITLSNYRSVPAARFQAMEAGAGTTYTVTVDSAPTIAAGDKLTFGDDLWTVTSVNPDDNTFVIANSSLAYVLDNTATYTNGDSRSNIYFYEQKLLQSATLDSTSSTNTGPGVVTFTINDTLGLNPNVVGNHLASTVMGCYALGKRYIGSTTVGDLEQVSIYRIGTRTGTTLAASVQSQTSAGIVVTASPTSTDGTWDSFDKYGIENYTGGWTPLVRLNADHPIYTLVVGSGETQEMVRVVWSGGKNGTHPHGPTMDGKTTSPAIWYLAPGQTFQYDHAIGEPVCTPNIVYSLPGLYNHAKDTPVLGAPDGGTVYNQTTGITDYEAAAALIGYNPSGTISTTADAYLDMSLPWRPSGDNGAPNIATTTATPSVEGSPTLEISGNDGFPSAYPSVLQPGIPFLPPEFGRVSGDVAAGSSEIPFKVTGEIPTNFPFYVNIGGEIVLVTGTNVIQ